jgi:uncharacterized protein (TIGR02246 family)
MRTAAQRDEVMPASVQLAEALSGHDAAAAAALYAEDARLLTTAEQILGRADIEAYWNAGMTLGLSRAVLTPTEVRVGDRVAVETGCYEFTLTGGPGQPAAVDRGTYFVLHRRDDNGSWRRGVELFDVDPAEAPGLDLLEEK